MTLTCEMIRYVCICCYQLHQVDKLKNFIMSLGCHNVVSNMNVFICWLIIICFNIHCYGNQFLLYIQVTVPLLLYKHPYPYADAVTPGSRVLLGYPLFLFLEFSNFMSFCLGLKHGPLIFSLGTEGYWPLF